MEKGHEEGQEEEEEREEGQNTVGECQGGQWRGKGKRVCDCPGVCAMCLRCVTCVFSSWCMKKSRYVTMFGCWSDWSILHSWAAERNDEDSMRDDHTG